MSKNIMDNSKFVKVAQKRDDLLFVLLTYGKQLDSALDPVRKEFKKADRACNRLANKLDKEGWVYYA
jgi:hypothetical protein